MVTSRAMSGRVRTDAFQHDGMPHEVSPQVLAGAVAGGAASTMANASAAEARSDVRILRQPTLQDRKAQRGTRAGGPTPSRAPTIAPRPPPPAPPAGSRPRAGGAGRRR